MSRPADRRTDTAPRRRSLLQRVLLLVALYAVPLAGLAVCFLTTGLNDKIAFAARERQGVDYLGPAVRLLARVTAPAPAAAVHPLRLLEVEDNAVNLRLITAALRGRGSRRVPRRGDGRFRLETEPAPAPPRNARRRLRPGANGRRERRAVGRSRAAETGAQGPAPAPSSSCFRVLHL